MRREEKSKKQIEFAFCIQILVFVLLFLGITAVLIRVFATSATLSRQAQALNCSVQICRDAAEAFTASGSVSETASALGGAEGERVLYFNQKGVCVSSGASAYTLTLQQTQKQTKAGTLLTGVFSVYDATWKCLYSLTAQVYQSEGGVTK